jgi:hypothetical protein
VVVFRDFQAKHPSSIRFYDQNIAHKILVKNFGVKLDSPAQFQLDFGLKAGRHLISPLLPPIISWPPFSPKYAKNHNQAIINLQ